MGLQAVDPDLYDAAIKKKKITTPSGMVLDGSMDKIEAPPTNDPKTDLDQDEVVNEVPTSLVDHLEFYLLNYFEQALYQQTKTTRYGSEVFRHIHCVECHIPNLKIDHDRRVAQGSPSPVMEALNCQFCSMIQRISNSRLRFNRL